MKYLCTEYLIKHAPHLEYSISIDNNIYLYIEINIPLDGW